MRKHWLYLKYVIRHKWYVFVECFKEGIIWRGIVHDWHKFLPDEWGPYAEFFYGDPNSPKGSFKDRKPEVKAAFDMAWLKHLHRAKHHWQWWILHNDQDGTVLKEMPRTYLLEMMCDWKGAGKTILGDKADTRTWFFENVGNMLLNQETEKAILDYMWLDPYKKVDIDLTHRTPYE